MVAIGKLKKEQLTSLGFTAKTVKKSKQQLKIFLKRNNRTSRSFNSFESLSRFHRQTTFSQTQALRRVIRRRQNRPSYIPIDRRSAIGGRVLMRIYNSVENRQATNIKTFYDSIQKAMLDNYGNTQGSRVVDIRFSDPGGDLDIFRYVRFTTFEKFKEDIEKLLQQQSLTGSDTVPDYYVLDTTWFMIKIVKTQAVESGGATDTKSKVKFFSTMNPPSKDNNCYFACVNRVIFKRKGNPAKKLREESGIPFNKEISIEDIKNILEDKYELNHIIYEDFEDHPILYKTPDSKNYSKTISLVLKDSHFEIVKKPKTFKKPKPKRQTKPSGFLFYDLETTFNRKSYNFLEPYAGSWYFTDSVENWKYSPEKHLQQTEYHIKDVIKNLLKTIREKMIDYDLYLIGFNNSRFDNFFVVDEAIKNDMLSDIFYCNNSILGIRMNNGICKSFDLCRFLNSSLMSACDKFKTNPKKQPDLVSHRIIQDYRDQGTLQNYIENSSELEKYTKLDVLCLVDLFCKTRKAVFELLGKHIEEYMTIGQMSYDVLTKDCESRGFELLPPQTIEHDRFIRDALVAGRSQAFYGRKKFNFPVQAKDVCSLYPFIMMTRKYPKNPHLYREVSEYQKDLLGIYQVKIIHQNMQWNDKHILNSQMESLGYPELATEFAPIVFPKRSTDVQIPLDWNNRDSFECKMTNIDIECIRDHGGEVEVLHGLVWDETTDELFNPFLGKLAEEKNRQDVLKIQDSPEYNESLREMCKLFSNTPSGKVIQRNFAEDMKRIRNSSDLNKFLERVHPDSVVIEAMSRNLIIAKGKKLDEYLLRENSKPSCLGVFTYAHARDYMYRTCLSKYIVLQTDTDSAFMPLVECHRFEDDNTSICPDVLERSKIYGDWEDDLQQPASAFISIAPKCYLAIGCNKDGSDKPRYKGVNPRATWYPESVVIQKLGDKYQENVKKIKYAEEHLTKAQPVLNERMYDELLANRTICIFTSQLQKYKHIHKTTEHESRKWNKIQCAIRQVFMMKTLK